MADVAEVQEFSDIVLDESDKAAIGSLLADDGTPPAVDKDAEKPPEGDESQVDDETSPEDDDETPPELFKIGDKEYTAEQVKALEEGGMRLEDYRTKTAEVAEQRKQVESLVSLVAKLTENQELVGDIRAAIEADLGEDVAKQFDAAIASKDSYKSPHEETISELQARLDSLEGEKFLEAELQTLMADKKLSRSEAEKVRAWAEQKYTVTEGREVYDMDTAYKLMNFDTIEETAKAKAAAAKPPPKKRAGARNISKQSDSPKTFDEIKVPEGISLFE